MRLSADVVQKHPDSFHHPGDGRESFLLFNDHCLRRLALFSDTLMDCLFAEDFHCLRRLAPGPDPGGVFLQRFLRDPDGGLGTDLIEAS